MGKDYTDIKFKNGSTLSIAAALDSDRGLRKHSCLVDETRRVYIKLSIRRLTKNILGRQLFYFIESIKYSFLIARLKSF